MTELEAATAALEQTARRLSAATTGNQERGDLPKDVRELLARLDGSLARLDSARRREGTA
ncbi:hypothetical protein [Rubellimicrobium arenae]|uniref:hypothetical protein n=1 Tax=Rubellimicrobium arenae TaxID=2817372 RepID=UPI001B300857|nr:hypothetical protein [Rubellimicrobium arenae]